MGNSDVDRKPKTPKAAGTMDRRRIIKGALAGAGIIGLGMFAKTADVPQLLLTLKTVADRWKATYPITTACSSSLLMGLWILSFVPVTPFELSLGFLFGLGQGYIIVFCGKIIGCGLSYLLGRTVAYDWAQKQFGKHDLLRALDLAISRKPFTICLVARAAYIPIALKNYGLAILSVRPTDFFASLICVELYNSIILVWVGSTASDLNSLVKGDKPKSNGQLAVMMAGCGFLLFLVGYISYVTSKTLKDLREQSQGQGGKGETSKLTSS
jgi:uncharacterized membrane protein YdjX (TVP38/TMEM64 family)